jgi:hypothetical protein
MAPAHERVLCLGTSKTHTEIRCAILAHAGYDAHPATVPDGYEQLRAGNFNLVIVATSLVAKQASAFYSALDGKTKTLLLDGFTYPAEMLMAVAEQLQSTRGLTVALGAEKTSR